MKKYKKMGQSGFTLTELLITNVIFAIVALSFLALFTALVSSAALAKRKAVGLTLATNQMEYLKSLPYNNLAVAGGSIYSATPLPSTVNKTVNNFTYTIKTSISYVDDAFDGCASYPTQALKEQYCRNYPAPTGAPATDTNPQDYKVINVKTLTSTNAKLAEVDTQVGARVAETASTTGALFVTVIDDNGNPVSGASVSVVNSTITPNVNLADDTDSNGTAIFYGLPPDTTNYDYVVGATKTGYSSLATIPPSGSLQPNYQNRQIFTQLSSFITLTLKPQGPNSIVIETTAPDGDEISNMKVYVKGGYKKYNASSDTSYYFDNMSPGDTRPTTDSNGLTSISNLVPGTYIFCGDTGATNCRVGGTTYYMAAAVPYSGTNSFNPIIVPTYESTSPPATTFNYNSTNYLQKVRLIMSTDSAFPRVTTLTPDDASLGTSPLSVFTFQISGVNLPCTASGAGCATSVRLLQGANTYTASCTGSAAGLLLDCSADISSINLGMSQLSITSNGKTLTIPAGSLLGGVNVGS